MLVTEKGTEIKREIVTRAKKEREELRTAQDLITRTWMEFRDSSLACCCCCCRRRVKLFPPISILGLRSGKDEKREKKGIEQKKRRRNEKEESPFPFFFPH